MSTNLISPAQEGYNAKGPCPHSPYIRTSLNDSAWQIGAWMQRTGRSCPHDCRPSRGDTFHINGMKVRMDWVQGCTEIERIA